MIIIIVPTIPTSSSIARTRATWWWRHRAWWHEHVRTPTERQIQRDGRWQWRQNGRTDRQPGRSANGRGICQSNDAAAAQLLKSATPISHHCCSFLLLHSTPRPLDISTDHWPLLSRRSSLQPTQANYPRRRQSIRG